MRGNKMLKSDNSNSIFAGIDRNKLSLTHNSIDN